MDHHLIDTSVWVEFLNAQPGRAREKVRSLAEDPDNIVTTEPVLMEIRAGTAGIKLARTEDVLNRFVVMGVQPAADFHAAADLYRETRRRGYTIRSTVDCLIAAVAIRTEVIVLHRDRDFDVLAEVASDLRCCSLLD